MNHMPVVELFSKRQKRLRGEYPDVYQYDCISKSFRVQVINIIKGTIGFETESLYNLTRKAYEIIYQRLCTDLALLELERENNRLYSSAIFNYFLKEENHEKCLDVVELGCLVIDKYVRQNYQNYFKNARGVTREPSDAIEELNAKFKESGIGYQFESGVLVKIDSQFIHSKVVKPVLYLLGKDEKYVGANDEFLSAHEHYRHKRYKECINDCLKSFESLMKAILKKNSWPYEPSDTSKKLINRCLHNKLVPGYLQTQFSSVLELLLASGVPTIRNKEGSHGQGIEVSTVPEHLASYALHLTATNLSFLAKCQEQFQIHS